MRGAKAQVEGQPRGDPPGILHEEVEDIERVSPIVPSWSIV